MKYHTNLRIEQRDQFLPYAILIILSLIWGSSFILMKKSLAVFDIEEVAAGRIAFASLSTLPLIMPYLKKIPKDRWKYIFISGILGNLFPSFLFSIAISNMDSSLAGILNALTPLFTLIVGIMFYNSRFHKQQLLGLLIALIGSVGLTFVNSNGQLGSFNYYALLVVVATIFYAINANNIKAHLTSIPSKPLTGASLLTVGPVAILYLMMDNDFLYKTSHVEGGWLALSYLIILGVLGTGVAMILFNMMIQKTSAVFASSVTYLIPIVAVAWGFIDGENLFFMHFIGMVLILIGVRIVSRAK